ncbi:hypothetical protein BC936DRAFT_148710 [Jimgerdemannia flammicorona]|uniref:DUF221-domain-containing protein n=1 Tax=Jimgerdemannia flammicorona TaxID=994334 RepID=A0A433D2G5_9FUNG|nr:hypothetical protein BC936DRAFT_148710 [Jimgerdemannia flammicorona]
MSTTPDQQRAADSSISAFGTSITFNSALLIASIFAFGIFRTWRKNVYSPRTYFVKKEYVSVPSQSVRLEALTPGARTNPTLRHQFLKKPTSHTLPFLFPSQGNGPPRSHLASSHWRGPLSFPTIHPDGTKHVISMFLHSCQLSAILSYHRLIPPKTQCFILFSAFSVIASLILAPLNAIGEDNSPGLKLITFGNVLDTKRLWAHLLLTALFSGIGFRESLVVRAGLHSEPLRFPAVLYTLRRECLIFLNHRRAYQMRHATAPHSRVLLIRDVPAHLNNARLLRQVFYAFPGGVERVYVARDPGDLPKLVKERNRTLRRLEGVESRYVRSYDDIANKGKTGGGKIGKMLARVTGRAQFHGHRNHPPPKSLIRLHELATVSDFDLSAEEAARGIKEEKTEEEEEEKEEQAEREGQERETPMQAEAVEGDEEGDDPAVVNVKPRRKRKSRALIRFGTTGSLADAFFKAPGSGSDSGLYTEEEGQPSSSRHSSTSTSPAQGPALTDTPTSRHNRFGTIPSLSMSPFNTIRSLSRSLGSSTAPPLPPPTPTRPAISLAHLPPRPTTLPRGRRVPFIPAAPVDAIKYYRTRFLDVNQRIAEQQARVRALKDDDTESGKREKEYCKIGAAFVLFRTQMGAQTARQCVTYHSDATEMGERYADVVPADVVWTNLAMSWKSRMARKIVGTAVSIALVVFWGVIGRVYFLFLFYWYLGHHRPVTQIQPLTTSRSLPTPTTRPLPVAFITSIATLSNLIKLLPFLEPVVNLSSVIRGIIEGLIPAAMLSGLMMVLPFILIYICQFEAVPLYSRMEEAVQSRYFFFLIINVLLVVTVAGTIFSSIEQILETPTDLVSILATSLPAVSTFFVNYLLLQGLVGSAIELTQFYRLLWNLVVIRWFANSPRQVFIENHPKAVHWGTAFPQQCLVFSIAMTFSTIAPLVPVFAAVYFGLFYVVYRYQLLYVYTIGLQTAGLYFYKALWHCFVGLLIQQVTMMGLFLLRGAWAQGIIALAVLVATLISMYFAKHAYTPQVLGVPVTRMDVESTPGTTALPNADDSDDEYPDLKPDKTLTAHDVALFKELTELVDPHDTDAAAFLPGLFQSWDSPAGAMRNGKRGKTSAVPQLPPLAIHRVSRPARSMATLYVHPSLSTRAPKVWLPRDRWGIAKNEQEEMREVGIESVVDADEDGMAVELAERRRAEVGMEIERVDASVGFPQSFGHGGLDWFRAVH